MLAGPGLPAAQSAALPAALLMPGQGSQYPGMGTGLYRDLPAFATIIDAVFQVMVVAGDELRHDWLAADGGPDGDTEPLLPLNHVSRSQSLLFAIDYALGRLLVDLGLGPAVMLGHSVGELAAATLAGVFDLDVAVRFLLRRADHLAGAPAGGMMAVAACAADVRPHLRPGTDIGAVNAPRQTIIAGTGAALRATAAALTQAGFTSAPVPSLTPFHSAVLEPVVEVLRGQLTGEPLRAPAIAIVSGYTTHLLTAAQATDPMYWAHHDVDPVLYWPALESLLASGSHLLIECGPGQGLTTLARRHPDVRSRRSQVLSLLGSPGQGPDGEADRFAAAVTGLGLSVPMTPATAVPSARTAATAAAAAVLATGAARSDRVAF